jgi:hypothetical protein
MTRRNQYSLLLFALVAGWLAPLNGSAQPQPVFLRLAGVGVGGNVPGVGSDLQVIGNFVYLAWGGLQVFSLSNPSAPAWVSGYQSALPANAVQVRGQYAYLAEGTTRTFTNDPGSLEIINVSNPANPVQVGSINTLGRANAVRVAGNYAYVAESTRWTGTNLLGALEIFDVSSPTNPVRVAIFDTAGSATSVDVSGNYVYLADGVTDLQILDVSNPSNPRRVGVYLSDIAHNACGFEPGGPAKYVQVVGTHAYSAGENGLHVLDISDPRHPTSIDDNFCFPIQSLLVSDGFVYATIWSSWANTFILSVLDARDPTKLTGVGWKANWDSRVFGVASNLVYLATNPLSVYEIIDRPSITSFSINTDSLILTWESAPGFVLQRTTSMVDPVWSNVPGSEGNTSISLPITGPQEFFRVAKP